MLSVPTEKEQLMDGRQQHLLRFIRLWRPFARLEVAERIFGLPVPQIAAHGIKVLRRLETEFLLGKRGVRSEVGHISPSVREKRAVSTIQNANDLKQVLTSDR